MLTVIFSSFNGEPTVQRMLEACCNLAPPDGGWKLVAVDNGSTDRTGDIMRAFGQRLPIEILTVAARGKNRALNVALDHVEGDLVVLTDDDVIPDAQWLRKLEECARDHPDHELFGGPILPHWPRPPDPWILADVPLGVTFALTDRTIKDGEVSSDTIWGPNMAIRKSVLDRGIRFNSNVGPDGTSDYMMGSETEFTRRLARDGVKAWFCADAQVSHMIREHQLSVDWILQRAHRHGRSAYFLDHKIDSSAPTVFGVERWLYTQLVSSGLRAIAYLLRGRKSEWFKAMRLHYYTRGGLAQARAMRGRTGP